MTRVASGIGARTAASQAERVLVFHVIQGEQRVGDDPDECLSTLLGSCVAACLHDPMAGVGGMNHFLLPGDGNTGRHCAESLGVHAMELLVNAMLARGASRQRLEAKLFGGADTMQGLSDVGARNAAFASAFLAREGIRVTSECRGGARGRKVQFWPASGRARRSFMNRSEAIPTPVQPRPASVGGSLELF